MYFAIKDYLDFRSVKGRYTPFQSTDLLTFVFIRSVPESILAKLSVGDPILMGNFNSFRSWLVMYYSNSITSHVAQYAGDGMIFHSTLDGLRLEPIKKYFGWGRTFIPVRGPIPKPEMSERFLDYARAGDGKGGYNYRRVIGIGISSFLCLHHFEITKYRFFDIVILWALLVTITIYFTYLFLIIALVHVCLVIGVHEFYIRTDRVFGNAMNTPGSFEKFLRFDQSVFSFIPDIAGFQKYMLTVAAYLKRLHGEELPEGPLPVPEGLQLKVKPKNNIKSFISFTKGRE